MKSSQPGASPSRAQIGDVTSTGFWLKLADESLFLSYENYPWFRGASRAELEEVQLLRGHHLHWETLDVDLCIDSLHHPGKYPLKAVSPLPR